MTLLNLMVYNNNNNKLIHFVSLWEVLFNSHNLNGWKII
jgi:hypothetical protein